MRTDTGTAGCNIGGCGIDGACRVHQDKAKAKIGLDSDKRNCRGILAEETEKIAGYYWEEITKST